MKHLIITIIILTCIMLIYALIAPNMEREVPQDGQTPEKVADIPQNAPLSEYGFEDLMDAIEQVESGGNANAVGDGGAAIGAFQIHKIYVDDVNRIMQDLVESHIHILILHKFLDIVLDRINKEFSHVETPFAQTSYLNVQRESQIHNRVF